MIPQVSHLVVSVSGKLDRIAVRPNTWRSGRPLGRSSKGHSPETKFCSPPPRGCGLELPLTDFYRQPQQYYGRPGPRARCKLCCTREAHDNRIVRAGRAVFIGVERILVRLPPPEPKPPPPPPRHWPRYGSTPLCSRGEHPWPIETACRGYEVLGCGGWEPHVHRRCVAHACEEIEGMPGRLR